MKGDVCATDQLLGNKKYPGFPIYFSIFLLISFIVFFVFFSFLPINGSSMENTIHDNQYCLVQRSFFTVSRGDIVTIDTSTTDDEHIIIKRVIALSGDRILFMTNADNRYVDLYICKSGETRFTLLNEPYIKEPMRRNASTYGDTKILKHVNDFELFDYADPSMQKPDHLDECVITVPNDSIFFLGDNRNVSRDSRYYGTRSLSAVTSKALSIL